MKKQQVNIRLDPGTIKKIKIMQTYYIIHEEETKSQADIIKMAVDNYYTHVRWQMEKLGILDPTDLLNGGEEDGGKNT